ncbi:complement C1q-like protein 4 [Mya arenaria]|uniref:complement C1q-like protein 4 n=1 Tax=Mya arenaria TaxID=6604 RepID=UPI0022DFE35B|nr:complement C1q-like protein 4 [Mya arenaria]
MGTMLGGGCIGNDQEQIECNIKPCDTVVLFYAHGPKAMSISFAETIVYGSLTIDYGGGYNSANGVFTAPHEGLYLFTSQVCIQPGHYAYTGITKEGVVFQASLVGLNNDYTCSSMQAAINMRVGEKVWVHATNSSKIYESRESKCSFSGMLIKP